jgi:hypothetical protein
MAVKGPATLVVLDIDVGKSVASVDCCGDTHDLFHDPHVKRLYITDGAGCIIAIHQTDADHYRNLGHVPLRVARMSYSDSYSRALCVGVPHRPGQAAAVRVYTDASR